MVWLEVFEGLLLSSSLFLFLFSFSIVVGNDWLWLLMCVLISDCWLMSVCSSWWICWGLWIRYLLFVFGLGVVWVLLCVGRLFLDMEFVGLGGCWYYMILGFSLFIGIRLYLCRVNIDRVGLE